MILGCVLAGGASSRFGSDKALAELGGRTLIARAVDSLSGWCEHVVVVGLAMAPAQTLPDWPRPGMGPLAGLAAALHLACDQDYESVLTCGVDSAALPEDLLALLTPGPAYIEDQPVIGLWPAQAVRTAEEILEGDGLHSMYRFTQALGARAVPVIGQTANINTPPDLAALEKQQLPRAD